MINPINEYLVKKSIESIDFNKLYKHFRTGDIYAVSHYIYLNDSLGTDALPHDCSDFCNVEGRVLIQYYKLENPGVKFSQSVEKFNGKALKDNKPGNWVPRWIPLTKDETIAILIDKIIELQK